MVKMLQFQWLDEERLMQEMILDGAPKQVWDLFDQISALDCGFPLMRFLDANANTLKTMDDIAYFLRQSRALVENTLCAMVDLHLARRVEIAGFTFFGITDDVERQQIVHDLCVFIDRWHKRLERIERVLDGKARRKRVQPIFVPLSKPPSISNSQAKDSSPAC